MAPGRDVEAAATCHTLDRAGPACACFWLQRCANKGGRAAAQEKKEDVPASQSNHVKRKLKSRNQSRKLDEVCEAILCAVVPSCLALYRCSRC